MSDEIYEHIYYDNYKPISLAEIDKMYDKTITVNGLSKAYAMTGWRVGYIGAPEWIAKACTRITRSNNKWNKLYSPKSGNYSPQITTK